MLPPAKALPACDVDACTPCDDTLGDVECCRLEEPFAAVLEVLEVPLSPQASPSSSSPVDEDAATRRRCSPPPEDIVVVLLSLHACPFAVCLRLWVRNLGV